MEKNFNKTILFFILPFLISLISCGKNDQLQDKKVASGQLNTAPPQNVEVAGEFFGVPVPIGNYRFVEIVVRTFNTNWGGIPRTAEELERRIWDDLLLSYEAFRRGVKPSRQEVEAEITSTLKGHKVKFDWKKEPEVYKKWVKDTLGEPIVLFENQLAHLVTIKKLRQQILDSIKPEVKEEEAFQEFLNEYNTLEIELFQFGEIEKAEEFYQKAKKNPGFWEREKKIEEERVKKEKEEQEKKGEKKRVKSFFQRPGFVCLEFLMDMWKLPKKAVYDMIEMDIGTIYPPAPIYKGYGVFKVLKIRRADESEFAKPKRRQSYYEQIKMKKKYQGLNKWLEDLREKAKIKKIAKPRMIQ
jgi:hypothetical protein